MAYKHGIYTESVSTTGRLSTKAVGTVPVYIGTAPSIAVNKPILINSYSDFVSKCGYSEDWESNTLCEVAYAHFKNNTQSIAPFVVIGLQVTVSTTAEGSTTTIDFEGALKALDSVPIVCGVTPNILVAPSYSATYAADMIAKCEAGIAGKWKAVAYIDIPTDTVTTIANAISYKTTNATTKKLTNKYARLHYPKAKYDGKVFHLSVLDAVASQIVDNETEGVSCRSSSNKRIICDVPTVDGTNGFIYSEAEANSLNEKGITTINYIGGAFKLWGGHMANYDEASKATIEAKDRSDATVRMQVYLDNWLKREYIDNIDAPLTRREIDNLLSSVNIGLNSFVNSGYLLKGECYFDEGDNTLDELADGNLVLEVLHTEMPNGKSISFKLSYDVSGLETIYEAEEV